MNFRVAEVAAFSLVPGGSSTMTDEEASEVVRKVRVMTGQALLLLAVLKQLFLLSLCAKLEALERQVLGAWPADCPLTWLQVT